jgi:hypothetical protein
MSAADLRLRAQRYIALRRAVGFRSRPSERLLLDFIGFVESRGFDSALTAQIAVEWACLPAHGGGHAHRLSIARGFLTHLRAAVPDTEGPRSGTPSTADASQAVHLFR